MSSTWVVQTKSTDAQIADGTLHKPALTRIQSVCTADYEDITKMRATG